MSLEEELFKKFSAANADEPINNLSDHGKLPNAD
jgi:hypothetical protein